MELSNYVAKMKPIVEESNAIVQKVNRMWSSMGDAQTPTSGKKRSRTST